MPNQDKENPHPRVGRAIGVTLRQCRALGRGFSCSRIGSFAESFDHFSLYQDSAGLATPPFELALMGG